MLHPQDPGKDVCGQGLASPRTWSLWNGRRVTGACPPHPMSPSVAILLYLARKYEAPDHWYPQDLQARARVDEYLSWQHTALRTSCTRTMWQKVSPGREPPRDGQGARLSVESEPRGREPSRDGQGARLSVETENTKSQKARGAPGQRTCFPEGKLGTQPGNDPHKVSYQKHIYLLSCFRLR